jgi:5-oxoprolinase (ATP-hydrolysing)
MHSGWEFWIDVGGTFTDCVARRPDGSLVRHKLLSSGVTKGIAAGGSNSTAIIDHSRSDAPRGFWNGMRIRLLDSAGRSIADATVAEFDSRACALLLDDTLPVHPSVGQSYELLSTNDASMLAVRWLLGLSADAPIPSVIVRLGTTRGTNALLTRSGAKTALVTTRGFGDVLEIGHQNRPRLFELAIRKRLPLYSAAVEIDERMAADGTVLVSPKPDEVRRRLRELLEARIESLAICLLHGSAHPAHEQLVAAIAREVGFREISVSSEVAPLVKIVARGDTTVMDAYLNPVLRSYIGRSRTALGNSQFWTVTSAGAIVSADRFVGKDSVLSGPAAGVVGFARAAGAAGFSRAIGFDMGGTSTDVSRFDGQFELEYESEKAGVRIVSPMMAIETVAAGGGSICGFDGVKLVVGPDSAGADPGPACYGRGGPLAVTDLNFFLGRILPERFPFPLDRAAVERRLDEMAEAISAASGPNYSPIKLASGFLEVANANMARALRSVSIARGCNPGEYVLVPFGGAAGQHVCALARELGIRQLLCHPDAGLLSARGIGLADHVRHRAEGVYRTYSANELVATEPLFERLEAAARIELLAEAPAADNQRFGEQLQIIRRLDLRYRGVEAVLTIPRPSDGDYAAAYHSEHARIYGYMQPDRPLEIVAARVEAIGRWAVPLRTSKRAANRQVKAPNETNAWFAGQSYRTQVFNHDELQPGDTFDGPAIVCEVASTTVVDPEWRAEVLSQGELLVTNVKRAEFGGASSIGTASPLPASDKLMAVSPSPVEGEGDNRKLALAVRATTTITAPDPVQLEVFNNHFAGIAEQMGIMLRNTAASVNVKERLDFSCAIFTARGELVVNAPHIPVHLGAMGQTVRRVLVDNPVIEPGDVFITNDPYRGGSHLPDITVVTPVHEGLPTDSTAGRTPRLLFFTASRAHYAEIGGIVPGSMPPLSMNLAEEGVLIRNFKLFAAGRSRFDELRSLLLAAPYPTRAVADNLTDIGAQVAANRQGTRLLAALIERRTWPVVESYMRHIQAAAERKLRLALAKLRPGRREFTDHLDDGSPIHVTITIDADAFAPKPVIVDFTGTGPVVHGNLNANPAVVTAALMYVLRLLIDEEIPLNEGVLAPVKLVLPDCLLNPPERATPQECAAVAGGNVETSQRVVDALLGALGLAAASQGTMNNLLFGDESFGYYETICGGSGAAPDRAGGDAVHTHMTNTRLTDPEVIERRYPVRVREFSIRRGSGGAGRHRGGDGVIRRLEFMKSLMVSILSERRGPYRPYGLEGGQPGALGRNTLIRADGATVNLGAKAQFTVSPGDLLVIETPGGGGYGNPSDSSEA